jgi:hypothetical protein
MYSELFILKRKSMENWAGNVAVKQYTTTDKSEK